MDDARTPLEVRADRGRQMNLLDRLTSLYVEQGYLQPQARARALSDISRQNMAQKYSVEPIQLQEEKEVRDRIAQGLYLRNPRYLAQETSVDPATLPGYDPTYRPLNARSNFDPIMQVLTTDGQTPIRFSRPMTQEDANIARIAAPIPKGEVSTYRAPSLIERAMEIVRPASLPAQSYAPTTSSLTPLAAAPATAVNAPAPTQESARSGDLAQMYEGYSLPNRPAPPEAADAVRRFDTGIGSAPAVQRAVQVARQSAGVPVPPQRPDSLAPQPPSAEAAMAARTNAVRDAWTRYNETGSAADFVRASALMQANTPERQQEADGGSIKAKSAAKPDPVHKALEIIHHLLVHGR